MGTSDDSNNKSASKKSQGDGGHSEKFAGKTRQDPHAEQPDAPNRGRPHHGLDDGAETGPGQPVNPQRTELPARHDSSFQTGGSGETNAQHVKNRNVADEDSEAQRKKRADSAPGAPIHPDGKD